MDIEGLNLYTLKELKELDGSYYAKVKNSNRFIPVKIKNGNNKYLFEKGRIKKDYSIKYIILDELENFIGKKLEVTFK